ncbi:MAG TPA: hypothetical protein VNY51_11800 [Candidatus Dormibacteraeota bacterium]|jgi:hypothetical protein|nr:hypothetical protein [Candidatus Dormibacteraeota bacterium]
MAVRFQTFSSSVRPIRVAVLTKVDDPDWQSTCLAIIEFFTQLWGGQSAIIVPTNGKSIDDVFWALLSAHDPDLVLVYQKTGEDMRRTQSGKFEKLVEKEVGNAIAQGVSAAWAREEIPSSLARTHWDGLDIDHGLLDQLLTRLAPFSFERKITNPSVTAGCTPFYPLTSIIDVLDQVPHASETVDFGRDGAIPTLWLAATVGCATQEHLANLNAKGVAATPVSTNHGDEFDLIRWGIQPWKDFQGKTLFDISRAGLGVVRSARARTFELPNALILGDTIQDFCLFYSLARLHGRATWLPSWFLDGTESPRRLRNMLSNTHERGQFDHADSFELMSSTLSLPDIEKVKLLLPPIYPRMSFHSESLSVHSVSKLVGHPLRTYAVGNIEKLSTHQLLDNELPGPFESPSPAIFKTINPQMHRWIAEVGFRRHRIPRHPALGSVVLSHTNLGESSTRIGVDGLAYVCPGAMIWGTDPDFNLVRPSIRVPNAIDIFRYALKYCGYECEVSDKGRYEDETIDKLGGIGLARNAFRNRGLKALFEKFIDRSTPGKGVFDEGSYLKDDRRYLNFAAILKLLGDNTRSVEVIDDYISKAVFYRGLILKCSHCSDVSWFSISEITHEFTCRRCGRTQQYKKSNWRHPDEPSWFYKLDEIVYQALLNHSAVPILTLGVLREESKDSFLFCPELRIGVHGDEKHFMELDICCICDGKLCIGEAKSNGTLSAKGISASAAATKYRDLAEKLGATRVVFSTSRDQWDNASDAAIDLAFGSSPTIEVSKLAASDL